MGHEEQEQGITPAELDRMAEVIAKLQLSPVTSAETEDLADAASRLWHENERLQAALAQAQQETATQTRLADEAWEVTRRRGAKIDTLRARCAEVEAERDQARKLLRDVVYYGGAFGTQSWSEAKEWLDKT